MLKQKFRFIFKANGTLKRQNLIDQKIPHISRFIIRVNVSHYKNQLCVKKISTFFFTQGFYARVYGILVFGNNKTVYILALTVEQLNL